VSVVLFSYGYRSHIYWLHHNIGVPCPVVWNLMRPLNVEIICNDISFNFNYVVVVMYGIST
jgi:hypothetical protein